MNDRRIASHLMLLITTLFFTSCMSFNDDYFDSVADSLGTRMPELRLEKEMAMGFGSGIFDLVDLASAEADGISAVEKLRVAVYKVTPREGYLDFPDAVFTDALRSQGTELEWERIVRVREEGEQLWVFAGMDREAQMLDAICVFVLERDELVLINMEGEFQQLFEYALNAGRRESNTAG